VNNYEKAQAGLEMLKGAILSELEQHPHGMTNAEIVHKLGLESDFGGSYRNYLSWSILGVLLGEGKVKCTGERQNKTYHLIEERSMASALKQS
jgi:hypothetical protein